MAGIWQLTLLVFSEKTFLSGLILNQNTTSSKGGSSALRNAYAIASSYLRKTCRDKELRVEWGDVSLVTRTDRHGYFFLETEQPPDKIRECTLVLEGKPLSFYQRELHVYHVLKDGLLVISDIDDTVMVSNTNNPLKRFFNLLFRPYRKRKPVASTSRIFHLLGDADNDFLYVSRSEYNLFPMLSNFMNYHGLPKGPLFLTPFLSLGDLLQNKKDPEFKNKTINFILDHTDHQQIVLFGDDTQHDLKVYAEIARMHAPRIHRVFIRQTRAGVDKRRTPEWDLLLEYVRRVTYYNDTQDLSKILNS